MLVKCTRFYPYFGFCYLYLYFSCQNNDNHRPLLEQKMRVPSRSITGGKTCIATYDYYMSYHAMVDTFMDG